MAKKRLLSKCALHLIYLSLEISITDACEWLYLNRRVFFYLNRCFHILSLFFISPWELHRKFLSFFLQWGKKSSFYYPYIEPYNTSILSRCTIMNSTDNHLIAHPRLTTPHWPYAYMGFVLSPECIADMQYCDITNFEKKCCNGNCRMVWDGANHFYLC